MMSNRIKAAIVSTLFAVLPSLVGAVDHRYVLPLGFYYANGVRVQADVSAPVVSPSDSSMLELLSSTNYVFTALPLAGHKTDGWRLSTQAAVTSGYHLQQLNSIDEYEGDTASVTWRSAYGNLSDAYFYLTPCFSWLNWNLAYKGNYSNIVGDYGTTSLVYTNSVTIADPKSLWNTTRTGYDIAGWSLSPTGNVQYAIGQPIANAGEVFGVAEEGDTVYLYAVWQKRAMQITLNAQGGSVASNSITAYIGETYSLPTPARQGFEFLNWSVSPSGGTTIANGSLVTRDDIKNLYAQWNLLDYRLNYNWNWADAGAAPASHDYGYTNAVTLASAPVSWARTGYDFVGWAFSDTTNAAFTAGQKLSPSGASLGITKDGQSVTLYGVWQKRAMQIALDAQCGTVASKSITAYIDEKYSLPADPVREGFIFEGWFTAPTGGTKISNGDKVTVDDIETLYAHWNLLDYQLNYDWNWEGAGAAPAAKDYGYTNVVRLAYAPSAWARIGYDFVGWAFPGATNAAFSAGQRLSPSGAYLGVTTDGQSVALYGVWQKRAMQIVLDAQGGTVASNSITAYIEEKYSLPADPVREGFIFEGWFTSPTGGTKISNGDTVTVDDIETLYAHWKLIEFTLAYDENAADSHRRNYSSCGWTNTLTVASLPGNWGRKGWDFLGWSRNSVSDDVEFGVGAEIPNVGGVLGVVDGGTNVLYAVWEKHRMDIPLYDEFSGDEPITNIVAYIDETYDGLPTNLLHYANWFEGWWTDPTNGEEIVNGQMVTSTNIFALYARWTPKEIYDVTVLWRDADGVETNETQKVYEMDPAEMPGDDVANIWVGHTFLRWEPGDYSCIETNMDFVAIYKTNEYNVAFYPSGGQGYMPPMANIVYGTETNLTANAFRRGKTDAWAFAGWSLDENATNVTDVIYTNSQEVVNLTAEDGATVELHAVWDRNLTDYSIAAKTEIVLSADDEGKWVATNDFEVVGDSMIKTVGDISSATLLTGKVYGNGTLSFDWRADATVFSYGLPGMPSSNPPPEFKFSVAGDTMLSTTLSDEWHHFETNITNAAFSESELSWSADSIILGHYILLANIEWVPEGLCMVSFDANGGDGEMDAAEFYAGEYGTLPRNAFTKVGYAFDGWRDGDGGEYVDRAAKVIVTNATTLTAQWIANPYTIHFDANGGSGDMPDQPLVYDVESEVASNAFAKTGYTFTQWKFGDKFYADGEVVSNLTATADEVLEFIAQWDANNYAIKFNANGGDGEMPPQAAVYDDELALQANAFTRTGYIFDGWSFGEETFAEGAILSNLTTVADGEVILSAVWSPIEYTISFAPGDASGTMEDVSIKYDESVKLPACGFSRTGYTFGGWSCGGDNFADGAYVLNLSDTDGDVVVLTATWLANKYTVKFSANGGDGEMLSQAAAYDEELALQASTFTRTGYIFNGWLFGEEAFADGAIVSNITAVADGEVTLSAVWNPIEYTISFAPGGGSGTMGDVTLKYDESVKLPTCGFSRTGYTFNGWSFGGNNFADGAYVDNLSDTDGDEVVLTATWLANKYTVKFSSNGGEGEMDSAELTYDSSAALPANSFTRFGYKFVGWATDADGDVVFANGGDVLNIGTESGEVSELFAVWEPISYAVRFSANGGYGTMDDLQMTYGVAANLTPNGFTRDGYSFDCWKSSGIEYADGSAVVNLSSIDGDVVVFEAQWTADEPEPVGPITPTNPDFAAEVFPDGDEELGEFTAASAATYNGWLRDTATGRIVALITVKTTAVKKEGAESRSTIKVTPLSGKKTTYKTSIEPEGNPVDEYGIVYGNLGLSGEFDGYAVEAALDFSKAKANTEERALVNEMPLGVWTCAFAVGDDGYAAFSVTVSKKGKAKVTGYLADGSKVSISAQGILGSGGVFAVPVQNARKGVGFVLWIGEDGESAVTDCADASWVPVSSAGLENISDGQHSLDFVMPDFRDYMTATDLDDVCVTPIGEESLFVGGGKWKAEKSVGKVAVDKSYSPVQTYVKHRETQTPSNLAALKLTYTAKTGLVKGSFKLWYLDGEKLRSDKVTVTGSVVGGKFLGTATIKKLGRFNVWIED